MEKINRKHLPNLDPLRFFAAAVVSFYHTDMILVANKFKSDYFYFFPFQHGDIAVVFFFVLSGFLITWLLLKEKEQSSVFSVKKFYLRRIFRIWPLYFLMMVLVFGYFNRSEYYHLDGNSNVVNICNHLALNIGLLLAIAPNVVLVHVMTLGYGNPGWSIGVEEQFYLIWPWVMKSNNSLKYIFYIIISVYLLSNGLVGRALQGLLRHNFVSAGTLLYKLLCYFDKFFTSGYSFRIDAMAIGAMGSYLVINKPEILKVFYLRGFQFFLYLVLALLMIFQHFVAYQFYAIIFILIIINVSCNPGTIVNIKSPVLNYFGKISYGIYMFHLIAIIPSINLVIYVLKLPVNFFTEILICVISLIATVVIAAVSFSTFEKMFLKFKNAFV